MRPSGLVPPGRFCVLMGPLRAMLARSHSPVSLPASFVSVTRGYVIMAMQDCGFSHDDIRRVVRQLYEVFDIHTINEAEQKYYHGNY